MFDKFRKQVLTVYVYVQLVVKQCGKLKHAEKNRSYGGILFEKEYTDDYSNYPAEIK